MRRIVQNHERFGFDHPGKELAEEFRVIPTNAYSKKVLDEKDIPISYQSLWRGLIEVVSAAALLHDIAHVPFGHTLEDEFAGIYERHDTLGGPRLYQLLFNPQSELKKVFSDDNDEGQWIKGIKKDKGITNTELAKLIYVILSWKERVDPPADFNDILTEQLEKIDQKKEPETKSRLENLKKWYEDFTTRKMFHPFMSDIIGNTICADLLDYLPRDRLNLGMEVRTHSRLHRYFTIRCCTLHRKEELRLSIMVTRSQKGGQRRDVATAVLDVMRERYEIVERVYYHHKKAAAGAMLAKLAEICPSAKPDDTDATIYPAPWSSDDVKPQNILHFSDDSLIEQLGTSETEITPGYTTQLRNKLYRGLKYGRNAIYRTLLPFDVDLAYTSAHPISFFAKKFRGEEDAPSNEERTNLENKLAQVAEVDNGDVIIYCPSPDMQSKEVDARLEIIKGRILPLRLQTESFTYNLDVKVLEQYYKELWRIYIFVSPEVFKNADKCQAIVDEFCRLYKIDSFLAYSKVRTHDFKHKQVEVSKFIGPFHNFLEKIPFADVSHLIVADMLQKIGNDDQYLAAIKPGNQLVAEQRLWSLLNIVILETAIGQEEMTGLEKRNVGKYINILLSGKIQPQKIAARKKESLIQEEMLETFEQYKLRLLITARQYSQKKT